jgi:hypothetical protein
MGLINGIGRCDFCDKRLDQRDINDGVHVVVLVKMLGELREIVPDNSELEFCNVEELTIWLNKTLEALPGFKDEWARHHERYDELAREGHGAWVDSFRPQQTPEEAYQAPQ